jgi:hypothetical protein
VVAWRQSCDTMEMWQLTSRSRWEGRPTMKDKKVLVPIAILLVLVALVSASCTFELVNPLPPIKVAFKSYHGRWVTAKGKEDGWALRQDTELNECGQFIQYHLANGKVALKTCYDRYVTAPANGATRQDWMLMQESKLGGCGQFDLYDLGGDRVALKTCAGNFLTAGDGNWPSELEWSTVGETDTMLEWEVFTVLRP